MTYGIQVFKADTTVNLSQTLLGGRVFVQLINIAVGVSNTYTYDYIASDSYLKFYIVQSGAHSVSTSTVNGKATVTLTALSRRTSYQTPTIIAVFSTQTTEPDYGIAMTNDSGERLVSSIYKVPDFIARLTFNTAPSGYLDADSGYRTYQHEVSTGLGSGRNRIVLWTVPENSNDVWLSGTSYIGTESVATVRADIICPLGTAYNLPEAFIFGLDGAPLSADNYGIRIYGSGVNGPLLFDGGSTHLNIKGFETLTYNSTVTTVTSGVFSGNIPAILIPEYYSETWTQIGTSAASNGVVKQGVVRRVGTTLYSKFITTNNAYEDSGINTTYTYGINSNPTFAVDAQALGAGTVQALTAGVSPTGGTTTCSYDPSVSGPCTTTQSFIASTSGGTGAAISYAWSVSGTGFSISGGTTGSTCSVTNSSSGTTTYTGTVTCTVTQGATVVSGSYSLSHTHTSNITGISGTITPSLVVATCNYSGTSCSTSEVHTISTSGGDGTAKTYSWTIPTNTGAFTLSSPTTGTSVTVSKDAAAGTYTCTVQCAITQGSTTIYVTQNVSHTHSFVSSYTVPTSLGCNNGTYQGYREATSGSVSSDSIFRIYRGGNWDIQYTGGTTASGTWVSPQTTAIGDSYYVRFKRTAGSGGTTGTLNPSALNTYTTWASISGTQLCSTSNTITTNQLVTATGTYSIEISANQSTVLSTTTVNLNAIVYRGVIQ